jgi:hypothetical protein
MTGDNVSATMPRNGHRPRQREGELPEEGAGEAALQRDGRVHGRQGDGHGDDGPHQLARAGGSSLKRRHSFAQVSLDVLDHDDGVVDHQTDGKNNGQQREQVDGEAEELHQRHGANERHRNGHDRNQDRAQRAEETGKSPARR